MVIVETWDSHGRSEDFSKSRVHTSLIAQIHFFTKSSILDFGILSFCFQIFRYSNLNDIQNKLFILFASCLYHEQPSFWHA